MHRRPFRDLAAAAAIALAAVLAGPVGPAACRTPGSPDGFAAAGEDSVREETATDKTAIKAEMARVGAGEAAGTRQWERRKSPTVAMLSSMALPGLGQLYNGRRYKAMIATGVFTYYIGTAWFEQKRSQEYLVDRDASTPNTVEWRNLDILYNFHKDNAVTYLWWSGAVWLIVALDAYIDAHLYDVRAVTPTVSRGAGNTKYVGFCFGF